MRDPHAAWIQSGLHRYQVVNDVIFYEAHGKMLMGEAEELLALCHRIYQEYGFVFTIVDAKDAETADAEVRKLLADKSKLRDTLGTTYLFGANLVIRSFAILWQNVTRMMGRPRGTIRFVQNEAEAWQEITKDRNERRRPASAPA